MSNGRLLFFCLAALLCQTSSVAQPAFLDSSFALNGILNWPDGNWSVGFFNAIAVQPDHKILAAGVADSMLVIRYSENGTVDSTFGVNGAYNGEPHSNALAMALQPDGKILLCGTGIDITGMIGIVERLNANGTPDVAFGNHGRVTTSRSYPMDLDRCNAIAVQADGKIVVAGSANGTSTGVVRLQPDGRFDSSFGINGMVVTGTWSTWAWGQANCVAVTPDARIIAAGTTAMGEVFAVRMTPDGNVDTSFNHTGVIRSFVGVGFNYIHTMQLQPDGKVVLGGSGAFDSTDMDFILLRYNADGSCDTSYGAAGVARIDFDGGYDDAMATCMYSGGSILAAGRGAQAGRDVFALACINNEGKPDTTFGVNGKIVTPVYDSNDVAHAIALQPDGKVLVAGQAFNYYGWGYEHTASMVRYRKHPSTVVSSIPFIEEGPVFYPNPAGNTLYISQKYTDSITGISAIDAFGAIVPLNITKPYRQIETSNLANGIYFFQVSFAGKKQVTEKVVLLRH